MVELQQDLKEFVGCDFVNDRIDFKLNDRSEIDVVIEKLSRLKSSAGMELKKVDKKDGINLYFGDDSWVLARPSGTEPLMRIYFESGDESSLKRLEDDILKVIN